MSLCNDKGKEELEKIRERDKESYKLLRNHGWMEKTAMETFLRICNVKFGDDDLKKGNEPPDVVFRVANFEVTEVQDKERRRGDEYKKMIEKDENATCLGDLMDPYTNPSPMNLSELVKEVERGMGIKYKKYNNPGTCKDLDLLVYVNLKNRHIPSETKMNCSGEFIFKAEKQGWRSVSFLMGLAAGVIYAGQNAPDFIKHLVGIIKRTDNRDVFEDCEKES